jgi:hypothetical protein
MEQLVWAIILIIFIIFTALKNRARNKPEPAKNRERGREYQAKEERDRMGSFLEEILGIETPEDRPKIIVEKDRPKPLKERIKPKHEPILKEKVCEPELALDEQIEEEWEPHVPEKKKIYGARFPWSTLSRKDIPNAIILSEIIGPPISKRKSHRLF